MIDWNILFSIFSWWNSHTIFLTDVENVEKEKYLGSCSRGQFHSRQNLTWHKRFIVLSFSNSNCSVRLNFKKSKKDRKSSKKVFVFGKGYILFRFFPWGYTSHLIVLYISTTLHFWYTHHPLHTYHTSPKNNFHWQKKKWHSAKLIVRAGVKTLVRY